MSEAQSFTSLMTDLHQDINRVSSFSKCLIENFLGEIVPLRHWYINPNEKTQNLCLCLDRDLTSIK